MHIYIVRLIDDSYDPPRHFPCIGDLVIFYGDTDWVWVDSVPYNVEITGDEEMIEWKSGELAIVLSDPTIGEDCSFVKLLLPIGTGYYYADQLTIISTMIVSMRT